MKIIKYSLLFLFICLFINLGVVMAGNVAPIGIVYTFLEIKSSKTVTTEKWNKKQDFIQQSYYLDKAWTTITNPCNDCNFTVKLEKNGVNFGTLYEVNMGDFRRFSNNSAQEGEWYLRIKRSNISPLSTWHSGEWYIGKAK